ncbi:tellurite resistance TerB family protein [Stigmatella erecta]|nr:tellurite resistance TerB family protein [Stigmatella erecta]
MRAPGRPRPVFTSASSPDENRYRSARAATILRRRATPPTSAREPRPAARRLPGDDMTSEYPQEQLLAFVQAMANVAASDGRVTEDERQQLDDVVAGMGLSPRDAQVAALIEGEFQKPSRLTDIVSKIEIRELRVSLLRMLVEVACADGEISNEERASVKEAASAFGLDASATSELIDWALASIKLEQREREIMAKLL